jgi:hypothetical protein
MYHRAQRVIIRVMVFQNLFIMQEKLIQLVQLTKISRIKVLSLFLVSKKAMNIKIMNKIY